MKKLYDIKPGGRFLYGGVEWVKLEQIGGGALVLAAESLFDRAFDEENCNDWRKSSLRRELNGKFLDALIAEGAERSAFFGFANNLTADDGMTDYGTSTDHVMLLSCDLYRKYRNLIPKIGCWWWTLTPWTCDPEYSYNVRGVNSSGALIGYHAYDGYYGVRPLCYLNSEILVSVPGEEDEHDGQSDRAEQVQAARDDLLNALYVYTSDIWGDALGAAIASLFQSKQDAEEIAQEEKDTAAEG